MHVKVKGRLEQSTLKQKCEYAMKGKDKLPYIGIAEKFPLLNLIIELFNFLYSFSCSGDYKRFIKEN